MRWLAISLLVVAVGAGAWWVATDDGSRTRTAAPRAVEKEPTPAESAPGHVRGPEQPAPPAAPHALVGKVVGDPPLTDVVVHARWSGGSRDATTDADGAYRVPVRAVPKDLDVYVHARAPDGRAAVNWGRFQPGETEHRLPPLTLGAAATTRFGTEPPAEAVLRISAIRELGRSHPVEVWRTSTAADGRAELYLPEGAYVVRAHASGHGRASVEFRVGAGTDDVRIPLGDERRVKVIARSKKQQEPVASVRLEVFESWKPYGSPVALTDEHGEAWLTGLNPADTKLRLHVRAPGTPEPDPGAAVFVRRRFEKIPDDADEMVISVALPRTIKWEILDGDVPVPPDGTEIRIVPIPGSGVTPPERGRMERGRLVVPGWPEGYANAYALGPERTSARLWAKQGETTGGPTKFERTSDVTVTVLDADGAPAEGVRIGIFNQGNNKMADAKTNAKGVAKLEMLTGRLAELHVLGEGRWRRETIGTVDLREGDLAVEHTLQQGWALEVRATHEGEPVKPAGLQLRGLDPSTIAVDDDLVLTARAYLPKRDAVTLVLRTPGYLPATEQLPLPEPGEPIRHAFALEKGHALRVREIGERPKTFRIVLEREAEEGWRVVDAQSRYPRAPREEEEDGWSYTALAAGRYRIRAERFGMVYGPVAVGAGGSPLLVLDYRGLRYVRGRVVVPEGHTPGRASVRLTGEGIDEAKPAYPQQWRPIRVHRETGAFEALVPDDARVRVEARHALLAPDPKAGHWEGTGGADDLALRLVEGPTIAFVVRDFFERHKTALEKGRMTSGSRIEVRLFSGEPNGRPAHKVTALYEDGAWRCGGFPAGTYTVWIDVPDSVPVVRPDVALKRGENDLGDLPSLPGSTLRVRVRVREPFVPPRIYVFAHRQDEPRYHRGLNSSGGDLVEVTGLGAGRYRISGGATMLRGAPRLDQEIEVDGTRPVEIVYDLR